MSSKIPSTQRAIVLASRPEGLPQQDNFKLVELPVPKPTEGQFLVRNRWMSVDPYMRGRMREGESYVPPFELGQPLQGGCVGEVVASNHRDFQVGDFVLGQMAGWREYWVSGGQDVSVIDAQAAPPQAYLGVLGLTGMTAYVGLIAIAQIKSGETVFVSAASGAVGSIVCQIAKQRGCRVIGSAGSDDKVHWLKSVAGVDEAINYHDVGNLSAKLAELCPQGIDVYFENVGGEHLEAAIDNLNNYGRIAACGMISTYNDSEPQPGPRNLFKVISKRLRIEGFIVRDHLDIQQQFWQEMTDWIRAGAIQWEETVTDGLENAPEAFINLFHSKKLGKALVRL